MNIALFGGSFDPPHLGHTQIAEYLVAQKLVQEVWFVPCAHHPFHKHLGASGPRIEMLNLVLTPQTKICLHEIEKTSTSYSFETLHELSKKYPQHTFSWVIGSDQLHSFGKWLHSDELLRTYPVYVYPRKGFAMDELLPGMIPLRDAPLVDCSSTSIRQAIALQATKIEGLDQRVLEYIQQKNLYTTSHAK